MMEGARVRFQVLIFLGLCLIILSGSTIAALSTGEEYPELGTNCHPTPSENVSQVFVIGYGSLISASSKSSTSNKTSPNIPVKIKGFRRKFNVRSARVGLSTTFLGVDNDISGELNGVAFQLTDLGALQEFDKRERNYCRQEVKPDQVEILVNDSNFQGDLPVDSEEVQYWIYSPKNDRRNWPSKKFPIVQSYVDVFLSGCLEVGELYRLEDYADDCVKFTDGWNYSWMNDRMYPRRPWKYQPKAIAIDLLLNKHIPEFVHRVGFEAGNVYGNENCLSEQSDGVDFKSSLSLIVLVISNCARLMMND